MEMDRYMQRHVTSTSRFDLLMPSTSSRSSQTRKDDKSSGSINVDPSPNPMQMLLSSMTQMMKQQTTMMQMMQEGMNKPKEYPRPSYDQPRRYNNNPKGRRNFSP